MKNRRCWLWLVTLAWVLLAVGHAAAGESVEEQARRHFDRGVELADQGSHEQAVAEFTRAYQLNPSAEVLWKLGEAYAKLDRPIDAVEALEQYERDAGGEIDAERRAELDRLLAGVRGKVGGLAVVVQPDGAAVMLDGKRIGSAPLGSALRVLAGEHRVTASHPDYGDASKAVTVPGGERISIELLLQPKRPPPSGAGELMIECSVPGVRVTVDGKPIGQTPFFGTLGVPRGPHEVAFARPGYEVAPQQVEVTGDKAATVACGAKLVRPVPAELAGTVKLTVTERNAEIEVDGDRWPPDGRLPAGPHALVLREPGHAPMKMDFTLAAGETKELRIDLASRRGEKLGVAVDEGPSAGRVTAYITGAMGLAAGGVAFGLALWNDGRFDDWRTEQDAIDQGGATGTPAADLAGRQAANDELQSDIETMDGVAIGIGVAGGALLVTGIILFLATGDAEEPQGALLLGPQPGGGYLGWAATW